MRSVVLAGEWPECTYLAGERGMQILKVTVYGYGGERETAARCMHKKEPKRVRARLRGGLEKGKKREKKKRKADGSGLFDKGSRGREGKGKVGLACRREGPLAGACIGSANVANGELPCGQGLSESTGLYLV